MAKGSASKPAAESKDSTESKTSDGPKPTMPKVMSNKRRGYGINDPAFKWQLGGLLAGVAVAIMASTQQGKQVMLELILMPLLGLRCPLQVCPWQLTSDHVVFDVNLSRHKNILSQLLLSLDDFQNNRMVKPLFPTWSDGGSRRTPATSRT